jgi:hypothetical protein
MASYPGGRRADKPAHQFGLPFDQPQAEPELPPRPRDRRQELAMLREADLPGVEIREGKITRRVKPLLMMGVLRVIDDHAGGKPDSWPSIPSNC